ncbi:MAG: acyl carrier protein [Akkermansiaceae bacterium]
MSEPDANTFDQLRVLISEQLLPLPDDFPSDADLYEQGLDSMALMQLILLLEQEMHVHIEPGDLDKKHFQSLEALAALVDGKK